MKRVAAPLVGGIFTSFVLELLVYPGIYELWRRKGIAKTEEHSVLPVDEDRQQDSMLVVAATM
jgi:Cu(I)/Ag(I) efflux system membrane protein CusA/SilA